MCPSNAQKTGKFWANLVSIEGKSLSSASGNPIVNSVCPIAELVQAAAHNHGLLKLAGLCVAEHKVADLTADHAAVFLVQARNKKPARMRLWCMLHPQPGA